MLDRRPFWGIIIWLNLCVIIWLVTIQEPFVPETVSTSEFSLQQNQRQGQPQPQLQPQHQPQPQQQQNQQQQQQQQQTGKHLLAERKAPTSTNAELLQYAFESSGSQGSQGSHYPYQIHETSRDDRRLNINSNNTNLALDKTNNNTNNNSNNKRDKKPAWSLGGEEIQHLPQMTAFNTATPDTSLVSSLVERLRVRQQDERQLIDLNDFKYLMTQPACEDKVQVLILVHTAPNNVAKRSLIRQTWGGSDIMERGPLRLLFLLGAVAPNQTLQYKLEQEQAMYSDLVQGSFHDDYRNMTYKHVMALKWFHYNCPYAKILVKVDDDVFVNTPQLMQYIEAQTIGVTVTGITVTSVINNNNTATTTETSNAIDFDEASEKVQLGDLLFQQPRELLFCQKFVNARVKRSYRSKWRVSFQEYPKRYYPPYCPGYAIIYSADVVSRLYKAAQEANYFWIDDVMVTGVLAQRTGTSIMQLKPYVLFSDTCTELLKGIKDVSAVEFLFSWHSISPEEIRALWTLYAGDPNDGVSTSTGVSESDSDGSSTIISISDAQNTDSTYTLNTRW